MGLFDFFKDMGEKIFGSEDEAAEKIKENIEASNPGITDLDVTYKDGVVELSGTAASAEAMEKTVLMAGNVQGVSEVKADSLSAPPQQAQVEYYVIQKGDTLSAIAKTHYGNANDYPRIFEANREVIKNADLIYPGQKIRIPMGWAPRLKNKSFAISAVVEILEDGAEGVLMTQGGCYAGLGLYLLEARPVFHYNLCDVERHTVAGSDKLSPGKHVVAVDFNYDGGGVGKGGQAALTVDGKEVASEKLPQTIAFRMSLDETLDIGEDTGTPVGEDYQVPFKFTGDLEKVTINITEEKLTEEQLRKYREGLLKSALN